VLEGLRDFSSADFTRMKLGQYFGSNTGLRSAKTLWHSSLNQRMLVNDKLVTVLAEHVVNTVLAFVIGLILLEGFTTVITKEPIMIEIFFLLIHGLCIGLFLLVLLKFSQNILFELLLFGLCLLSESFLMLRLTLFGFLALFLTRLWLYPHRLLNLARVLHNLVAIRLLKPEIVLGLVLVHLHTSLLILLVDLLEFLLLSVDVLAQPLSVHNVVPQENVRLVQGLVFAPYFLYKFLFF
jgi:hypothetical protein